MDTFRVGGDGCRVDSSIVLKATRERDETHGTKGLRRALTLPSVVLCVYDVSVSARADRRGRVAWSLSVGRLVHPGAPKCYADSTGRRGVSIDSRSAR
jgi:hypothetical protein